jgi:hypothetical protein
MRILKTTKMNKIVLDVSALPEDYYILKTKLIKPDKSFLEYSQQIIIKR